MQRRGFLAVLGGGAIGIFANQPPHVMGAVLEDTTVELRVYGAAGVVLAHERLSVVEIKTPTGWEYYGPDPWDLVFEGPITVTRVAISAPARLRAIREEFDLPVRAAGTAQRGETITVWIPKKLLWVG